ncbi:single-stranded-DNA-specific exonuclease RecJ [Bordetella hinzii]|uniref:Single-stranded-DNA-specific exonuclease RecJ n=2 Tax=Bordetella hinzii TaxID=103855 RepID=A0AAN1S0X7_9BORD|nr:single-stranded-DNA-specific exonuclease RecJ [Bordetella hinzii]AZW19696.1 single-stranded-DNA-specific exonuclease RecJ [Bordetella hinzii]KCB21458.1 single-stranded-DNA-specific exonuclease RecJ [Bordetella hinzii OH87 BAL007II]KCB28401.1 single-stranded-DNA-specific exonuclease RecJ [Bordetella hinzii CA90 BAL1384]KCB43724.1 single-stranded-DNA-specific exonuclease RecJ [Bordetella hinzii 5132]KCB47621.1 single-stranded-DNA-specific exonuclease RecJ [Bordetella hinzii 4161]
MVTPRLTVRNADLSACQALQNAGIHPLLARLWAARGVTEPGQTQMGWPALLPPGTLTHSAHAAAVLADAIQAGKRLLIVADYDCDGATACAVGLRALWAMGANVDFLVPNRFETGYGLSPAVVDLAVAHRAGKPDLIITVDNGIASVEGVAAANAAGIGVVITDHHLPGDTLPDALAIVNPNQPGCGFPSKNLAGVGVIFYMMLALRAELRRRGVYPPDGGPRLDALSDLVALGTVADVVKLDANNRLLVTQGLQRMRAGRMQAGLRALFAVAGREPRSANGFDLGFALGPRINAAGRLADMSLGIACLTTDDEDQALAMARELDNINRERRGIEAEMREQAMAAMQAPEAVAGATVCVFDPSWHQGVVGLVASRLKEKFWRPTLAFAPAGDDEIRGSGRSIPDVHLRDALDLVSKRHPGLIRKFGGHAMAAGLTLGRDGFAAFAPAFDAAVRELTGRDRFEPLIETDGSLETGYANAEVAGLLQQQVWGAGFSAPLFLDEFTVRNQRLVGEKHLKLSLERGQQRFDAIWFGHDQSLPERIQAAYRLEQNVWNGLVSVQLVIEYAGAA